MEGSLWLWGTLHCYLVLRLLEEEKQKLRKQDGRLSLTCFQSSLVAQLVKSSPAMQESWIWSLGWEDPLEEGMATHSNTLAWRSPQTGEPGGLQSMGLQKVGHDWVTMRTHTCAQTYTHKTFRALYSLANNFRIAVCIQCRWCSLW